MSKTSCQRNEKYCTKAAGGLAGFLIGIFLFSIVATGLVPADAWANGCCVCTAGAVDNPSDNATITCSNVCNDSQIGKSTSIGVTINMADNANFSNYVAIYGGTGGTINVFSGATLLNARIYVGTSGSITTSGDITSTEDNSDGVFGVILLGTGSHATVEDGNISNLGEGGAWNCYSEGEWRHWYCCHSQWRPS